MTEEMVVWCDDASHSSKRPRVFVSAFTRSATGWLVVENTKRRRMKGAAAVWLRDDHLGGPVDLDGRLHGGEVLGGHDELARVRTRLVCRRCRRPLIVRTGKLDAAFDQLAAAGRAYAILSEVRAILEESGGL